MLPILRSSKDDVGPVVRDLGALLLLTERQVLAAQCLVVLGERLEDVLGHVDAVQFAEEVGASPGRW